MKKALIFLISSLMVSGGAFAEVVQVTEIRKSKTRLFDASFSQIGVAGKEDFTKLPFNALEKKSGYLKIRLKDGQEVWIRKRSVGTTNTETVDAKRMCQGLKSNTATTELAAHGAGENPCGE